MANPILPAAPSRADYLRGTSPRFLQNVFRAWVAEFYIFWGKPVPSLPEGAPASAVVKRDALLAKRRAYQEANLAAAGDTAAETLAQSAAFIGFLSEYLPDEAQPGGFPSKAMLAGILSHKPDLEVHEDGTVTLVPLEPVAEE